MYSGEARNGRQEGLVTLLLPCSLSSFINGLQNFRGGGGLHGVLGSRGAGAPSAPLRSAPVYVTRLRVSSKQMMNGEDDGHVGEFIGEVIQHLPISLIRVVSGMEISPI